MSKSQAAPTTHPERHLAVGAWVSGSHGNFIANPNPAIRRRVKQWIFGVVVSACSANKYNVHFDNGLILACASRTLRLEPASSSLPHSEIEQAIQVAVQQPENVANDRSQRILEENKVAMNDAEEEEHLPESPEVDEGEQDEDEGNMQDEDEGNEQDEDDGNEQDEEQGGNDNGQGGGKGDNAMKEGVGRMPMGNNILLALFNRPQLLKRKQIMKVGKQQQLQELLSWKVKKSQSQGDRWKH